MMQKRTRLCIDAEEAFKEVKHQARAFGVLCNAYEQKSHFVDNDDVRYHESCEATMTGTCNRDGIKVWVSSILEA